jgi:hypothetical protein
MLSFRNTFNTVEVKRHARLVKAQDLIQTFIEKNTPKSQLIEALFEQRIDNSQLRRGDIFTYEVQISDGLLSESMSLCVNCAGILNGEKEIKNIGICKYRLYKHDKYINLQWTIPYEI